MGKGPTWSNSELSLILVWFSGKNQDHWCHRLSESRCLIGVFLGLRLQSTFFPSIDLEYVLWQFEYCWMLQSVLECVALSLPSLSRSNQSWIALICGFLCEVSISWFPWGGWPLGGSIPSKDPLWPSALFSNSLCMFELCVVLGDVVVRLREETKDYQGLKNPKCRWVRMVLRNFFVHGVLV